MDKALKLIAVLLLSSPCSAQLMQHVFMTGPAAGAPSTPSFVQGARLPSSGFVQAGTDGALTNGAYTTPLPQATLASNLVALHMFYSPDGTAPTVAISDNNSNTYTQAVTNTTANGNVERIYYLANAGAGIKWVKATFSGSSLGVADVAMVVSEWTNIATTSPLDVAHCNSGTSATITSGAMTIGTANDLVTQAVFQDVSSPSNSATSQTAFTVGSQTGLTWKFSATSLYESNAEQWGIYNTTGSFNPTFTQASSAAFASCSASFKSASAGTAPSGHRLISLNHEQTNNSTASPFHLQAPILGNLIVISDLSGGNSQITGVTSSPSCTWANTGAVHSSPNADNFTIIWYALNCAGSTNMTFTLTLAGTTTWDTYQVYDVFSPNSWSFGNDSGGQSGNQTSIVSTLQTCSSCVTPSSTTGFAVGNFGQDFCTANGLSAFPTGAVLDSTLYTGNQFDGPQPVDQNNGFWHMFYSTTQSSISTTWNEGCNANPQGAWAGRIASFVD